MNFSLTKKWFVLGLASANTWLAAAQSNEAAATDYASFSRLIADRNIFDPNRYAHSVRTTTRSTYKPRTRSTAAQTSSPNIRGWHSASSHSRRRAGGTLPSLDRRFARMTSSVTIGLPVTGSHSIGGNGA